MNPLVRLKLALVVIALIIWAWGSRTENSFFRVVGIVVLLVAFLLRFVKRKPLSPPRREEPPPP